MSRVIDSHVHFFGRGFLPQGWFQPVAQKWSASRYPPVERTASDVESGLLDPDATLLVKELSDAGVDAAVCLGLDWGVHLGPAEVDITEVHRTYGEMQKALRGKFYAVGGVDPRRENAVEIARSALEEDGLRGIKLYPPSGFLPGDERCFPIYELCSSLGKPVVFHTALIGYPHDASYANPLGVIKVQRAFPDLTIVLAHSGYSSWADEAIEVAAAHPHTYLELSNWNHDLHTDHGRERLLRVLAQMRGHVGAHRMLFGSDHLGGRRFSGGRSGMGAWRSFIAGLAGNPAFGKRPLTTDEIALILGGNAERVFSLNEED
ncbi:amidohydrolase family protein [Streptomyces sp. TP-A0874]|uniref:amidohydrolase family protein n=1 Tax=Streptomyces sp. TP-A0874 TaxID=549819 RepID=UPI0008532BB4|nr:amidohydrolase family protein [Streptomyces sp. TP-A0874]